MKTMSIELDKRDVMRIISLLEHEINCVTTMTEQGRHCEQLRNKLRALFFSKRPAGKTLVEVFSEERHDRKNDPEATVIKPL
jgi:hypothetical protein